MRCIKLLQLVICDEKVFPVLKPLEVIRSCNTRLFDCIRDLNCKLDGHGNITRAETKRNRHGYSSMHNLVCKSSPRNVQSIEK
jgi:hypothetical protein